MVAVGPARVVRGVSVILHAILGELLFCPGRDIAHPKVPIANENRTPPIRGKLRQGSIAEAWLWRSGGTSQFERAAILCPRCAFVPRSIDRDPCAPAILEQIEFLG